ncbi:MAG TPA: ABC transporter ATP-binding protein [Microthrixaceae bacterium]|jgi:ABC-2 type transport system ATP-binding protein/lipopolysaccharide transport system ATP-binding protein|nr:ABC transporter ATP-binding protein [Microthrixaceae bacterium]
MAGSIEVRGVSKEFRLQADRPTSIKEFVTRRGRDKTATHFWALDDVSIDIPEGSMYALVGHNGSGKSTLLRCIAGIYRPDTGHVKASGRISTLLELGAGFHPDLSGRENVYLNATILGMTKKQIDAKFDEIVDFAGVEQFIDSPVKVYSSGMYVRLGFSVAVHVQPEILIIDEVIAVGDEQFQRKCFDHLYGLRRQGVTIVVVTHGMGTVETMCDGAAWLDHGVLQMEGPAIEVAAAYLKKVNDAEAEDRASHRTVSATSGATTESVDGPGEIEILAIEVRDASGAPTTTVEHGEGMQIAIVYRAHTALEDLVFGHAIHTDNGVLVAGTNTQRHGLETGRVEPGLGEALFVIDECPLIEGHYEVTGAINDRHVQHTFDRRDRETRLLVRRGTTRAGVGVVDIAGDWKVRPPQQGLTVLPAPPEEF